MSLATLSRQAAKKLYYQANRERECARAMRYHWAHHDKRLKQMTEYRLKHYDAILIYKQFWAAKNHDAILLAQREREYHKLHSNKQFAEAERIRKGKYNRRRGLAVQIMMLDVSEADLRLVNGE